MKSKIKLLFITITIIISSLFTACQNQNASVSKSGFYFDTVITITLYNSKDEALIDECFGLADKYEKMFSVSYEDSEISLINSNAGKKAVEVSDETIEILNMGIYYGNLSKGKFDITIGKLSELWNFSEIAKSLDEGNIADASLLPSQSDIDELLPHINYKNIIIEDKSVYLSDPDSKLDLGAIAKGYIADKMKDYLNEKGISSGIINLGGNILTLGPKADSNPYSIGIQYPFGQSGQSIAIVSVNDNSAVTSGVYERYYYVDNVLYHHLLNPEDGKPYQSGLNSVTIISDKSSDGDALSTCCFALGLEDGLKLIEDLDNTEAVFIDDKNKVHYTSGLKGKISVK